ncbi:NAD(P)-binding protein [Zopfia rhizophila CBS 207.26]|uniref:NAD(P)-binding protein n=1 Tax=Zopfia rhizophila CBS 207.26 TaxID=1314779 RepID=A0A6A6DQQ5_9PEZI|nr:NAD(P)-binding protein [Zopfia rhizophila CBS 207.26]
MDPATLPPDFPLRFIQFTKLVHQDAYPSVDPAKPELSLAGRVAIITGASRALVPAVARAGAKGVVLVAMNAEKLRAVEETVHKINPNVQTLAVPTDISDQGSVITLFKLVEGKFGHADILIHNAAVALDRSPVDIRDADPSIWWRHFEINTKGTFLVALSFLKSLPPDAHANIVHQNAYSSSKLAVQKLINDIATGYPNVTTISVHPGSVETAMVLDAWKRFKFDMLELVGAKFLHGRIISANWDVDELIVRKDEIVENNLLTIALTGKFGPEQFE